jgi:N-acetylmuramoyl-L-alanine amidase
MKSACPPIIRGSLAAVIALFALAGPAAAQTTPGPTPLLQRVVIDPGHGGADEGVVAPDGLTESRLTMALAQGLKAALEEELALTVYLTREPGQNPPLVERTALANGMRADVFLSLHAGGASSPQWSGFGVFVQDYARQAGLADHLAATSGLDRPAAPWPLAQARHLGESRRLAEEVDAALSEVLRRKSLGPQGAPLAVLAGADQAAVLVEVGYLTNPEEARRLKSSGYRDALIEALVRGLSIWGRPTAAGFKGLKRELPRPTGP